MLWVRIPQILFILYPKHYNPLSSFLCYPTLDLLSSILLTLYEFDFSKFHLSVKSGSICLSGFE